MQTLRVPTWFLSRRCKADNFPILRTQLSSNLHELSGFLFLLYPSEVEWIYIDPEHLTDLAKTTLDKWWCALEQLRDYWGSYLLQPKCQRVKPPHGSSFETKLAKWARDRQHRIISFWFVTTKPQRNMNYNPST